MKTKNIVLTVAGGILGAGAAVLSCCEICRLKRIISHNNEVVEGYKKDVEANNDVEQKQKTYIESLERVVEEDKKVIACQKEQISILEKMLETPKQDGATSPLPKRPSGNAMPPKKEKQSNHDYIFQYDAELKLVARYDTMGEAARGVGIKYPSAIGKVINGINHSAAGYFWYKGPRPLTKFPDKWIELSQSMRKGK